MPTFRSVHDLELSLQAAGIGEEARDIARTLRPVLLFLRQQMPDADVRVGASKIGGDPDLPEGFVWPERPPLADAKARASALARRGLDAAKRLEELRESDPSLISQEQIDSVVAKHRGMAAVLAVPMPLAFAAQLDLAALAQEAGFPEDFPDTGLLSIFSDTTSRALALHWHDGPAAQLRPHRWPQRLADYFDAYNERADWADDEGKWYKNAKCERLAPFSALAVPHHWKSAFGRFSPMGRKIRGWFDDPHRAHGFFPTPEMIGSGPPAANFGDRLGGWPSDIQHHVESEVGGAVEAPGATPWRHIFSWGAESWQGTRSLEAQAGDGANYVLMLDEDLLARRFDRVQHAYQQS
jgi:Domain of unknown function (DUF1963)